MIGWTIWRRLIDYRPALPRLHLDSASSYIELSGFHSFSSTTLLPGRYRYCHCHNILRNMYTPPVSTRRKRSLSDRYSDEAPEPHPKKPKLCETPPRSASPLHYLHSLSKVWLTREALREFNRSTQQLRPPQIRPEGRRPLTRGFRTELRSRLESTRTPASDFLQHCTSEGLRELKYFAKLGGPDLVDLRGVRMLELHFGFILIDEM